MSPGVRRLWDQPLSQRPASPWHRMLMALLFCVLFNLGCLMIHGSQLVFLLPLRILPLRWSRNLYNQGIRYTKAAFGCLLILMCQWFAPTKLEITFETEGKGRFDADDLEHVVVRNPEGEVLYLNLPTKFVLISNHQIYADWWYAWCLTYFIGPHGVHRYIYITLKKSLKWIPVIGWGMQFYNFIFLARSWASDRVHLASDLSSLGRQAEEEDNPLCFLLYPEGTLVSRDTRPISKKFADKNGIADLDNMLLPRSTGLHYSLRSLAPRIPDLRLIDLTIIYPGIPPTGYGQNYYTLRSIFMNGVPPPVIHIHLRIFNVATDIPIGDLSKKPTLMSNGRASEHAVEVDIPAGERDEFDTWLRKLWEEKDRFVTQFLKTLSEECDHHERVAVRIPLRLRRKREILDAFCFFLPAAVGHVWDTIRHRD